jgi:integrase
LYIVLSQTGARPSEICKAEAKHLKERAGYYVIDLRRQHKTGRKGYQRVIGLPDESARVCLRLAERYPIGPLFRNRRGRKWSDVTLPRAMRTVADKVGLDEYKTPYSFRHTWTTNMIERGMPIHHIVSQGGWRDTKMLFRTYGHLLRDTAGTCRAMEEAMNRDLSETEDMEAREAIRAAVEEQKKQKVSLSVVPDDDDDEAQAV